MEATEVVAARCQKSLSVLTGSCVVEYVREQARVSGF